MDTPYVRALANAKGSSCEAQPESRGSLCAGGVMVIFSSRTHRLKIVIEPTKKLKSPEIVAFYAARVGFTTGFEPNRARALQYSGASPSMTERHLSASLAYVWRTVDSKQEL